MHQCLCDFNASEFGYSQLQCNCCNNLRQQAESAHDETTSRVCPLQPCSMDVPVPYVAAGAPYFGFFSGLDMCYTWKYIVSVH